MTYTPVLTLLDRNTAANEAHEMTAAISLFQELADYGTYLMDRVVTSEERSVADGFFIGHLLRELVVLIDGMHVLLVAGCGSASLNISRSIVERSLQIEWSLIEDLDTKMLFLFVANLREELHAAETISPNTKRNQDLLRNVGCVPEAPEMLSLAARKIESINDTLSKDPFKEMNRIFDETKKNRSYDPTWIEAYCAAKKISSSKPKAGSFKWIANALGRDAEYEYTFTQLCSNVHGASLLSSLSIHVKMPEDGNTLGEINVKPVRHLEEIKSVFPTIPMIAIRAFQKVLLKYLPADSSSFLEVYQANWAHKTKSLFTQ